MTCPPHTPLPLATVAPERRLEALRVSLAYGRRQVVEDVSFTAAAGALTVIIGPNGSGKSSLLRAVTGERSATGEIRLNGRPLAGLSPDVLARCRGVLAQHTSLAFPLTVAEVVRLGVPRGSAGRRGDATALVAKALETVDLAGFAPRPYHGLSGGEQQRVHLARVLCQVWEPVGDHGPSWLFLDEPVSSLDIRHQILIMEVAADYARRGGGVVAVLHDLNLTALFADQVLVMKDGRLLAHGRPRDVLTDALVSQAFDHPLRVGALPAPDMPFVLPQASRAGGSPVGAPVRRDGLRRA